ncbi:MAG: methylenetetrahydrofolate reductase [Lachnospiraceae bacterium]|nr:methylenetetrahydrofolate reductase [Lachnospiraceae bacterium]
MIKDLYKSKNTLFSFETFPPKKDDDFPQIFEVVDRLCELEPDFISVTFGAGGSNSKKNREVAAYIKKKGVEPLAHLTSVGLQKEALDEYCAGLAADGVENILALRGDRPKTMSDEQYNSRSFHYANEMIEYLKSTTNMCFGAACYPDKHFEAPTMHDDLIRMRNKAKAGADFFITQLFFDNDKFFALQEQADLMGIESPISAGIMPITSAKQLGTSISLSGTSIPKPFADLVARYGDYPEDMRKAGIDYAINQIRNLLERGVDGIHLYTMNHPELGETILKAVR